MKIKKIIILIALVTMAVALISSSVYAYETIAQQTSSHRTNAGTQSMMGTDEANGMIGMMGTTPTPSPTSQNTATPNALSPLNSIGYIAIIAGIVSGISGLTYFTVYHKRQTTSAKATAQINAEGSPAKVSAPYDSISKTLTSEERKVLDLLSTHDGKYLQKYIRSETGLSRLKTHRIVSRLAERGVVTLEKTGNTNQVIMSDWLQSSAAKNVA